MVEFFGLGDMFGSIYLLKMILHSWSWQKTGFSVVETYGLGMQM